MYQLFMLVAGTTQASVCLHGMVINASQLPHLPQAMVYVPEVLITHTGEFRVQTFTAK